MAGKKSNRHRERGASAPDKVQEAAGRPAGARTMRDAPAGSRPARSKGAFPSRLRLALLLAVIALAVYGNSLKNGFTMDDPVMIVNNSFVAKGISGIPELLTTPHQLGFHVIANDEYRPLSLVLFAIIHQVFELNPLPYHLVSILLFAGCVLLLFLFLDRLMKGERTRVAFWAALLFAVHPVHTEVVDNVKSCDELLGFVFAFLSLHQFLNYSDSGKKASLLWGGLCLLLSLLSKETAITFLVIIPVIFFLFKKDNPRLSIQITVCAVAAAAIFLAARFAVLSHYHANNPARISVIENALAKTGLSAGSRLATAVYILGDYLKLLFIPWPLICENSYITYPYVHFSNPAVLASAAAYIFLLVFCIASFIKRRGDLTAFGILFFLLNIGLVANVFFLVKSTMADRFLFYPSAGYCLLAALLLDRWAKKETGLWGSRATPAALVAVSVAYLVITVSRNAEWVDNYTLYKADVVKAPGNSRMHYLLGYELFGIAKQEPNRAMKGRILQDAISEFRTSLGILEDYFPAADMGAAYFSTGQFDSAEVYDLLAVKLSPNDAIARNNLSGVYLNKGAYRRNVAFCMETISRRPKDIYAYADIGLSYMKLARYDSAVYYLQKGIAVDPKFFGFYDVLSRVYNAKGVMDSAQYYQQKLQELQQR